MGMTLVTTSSLTATQHQPSVLLACSRGARRKLSQRLHPRICAPPAPDWAGRWHRVILTLHVCGVSKSALQAWAMHALISPHTLCMYYMHVYPFLFINSFSFTSLNYGSVCGSFMLMYNVRFSICFFSLLSARLIGSLIRGILFHVTRTNAGIIPKCPRSYCTLYIPTSSPYQVRTKRRRELRYDDDDDDSEKERRGVQNKKKRNEKKKKIERQSTCLSTSICLLFLGFPT
ncbi:hypothetical protein GGR52DRAFT_391738 [Hypoxylon sp. FL1284]|nr:hypothetical protein GGR52DRAFT_391738 [Hypoxylon sp. FL1284]